MRKVVVLAVLVLLVALGGWLMLGDETPRSGDGGRGSEPRPQVVETERERASAEPEAKEVASKPSKRAGSKQDRDAMRRRIVDAMQARERAAAERGGESAERGGGASSESREAAKAEAPGEAPSEPGNLVDRTGNHGYLMKVMNEDLMPLVDECYALARETQPELAGMLVVNVDIIGDEEIGGVIEAVVPGQGNELLDPGLHECVRESLSSTTLPPPPEGGKDAVALSLRLEPDDG